MPTKPIPEGFSTLTPYLTVKDANKAIDFYKKAFGATEGLIMRSPDGKVGHAELNIGNSKLMLSDSAPESLGTTTSSLMLYVEDADSTYRKAVQAGATGQSSPEDMFWGDRYGRLVDPFGHIWGVATHKEDLTAAEIGRRAQEFYAKMQQKATSGGGHS